MYDDGNVDKNMTEENGQEALGMLRFLFGFEARHLSEALTRRRFVSFGGEKRPCLAESAPRLYPRSHLRTSGRLPCVSQRVETYAALFQVNTLQLERYEHVAVCLLVTDELSNLFCCTLGFLLPSSFLFRPHTSEL